MCSSATRRLLAGFCLSFVSPFGAQAVDQVFNIDLVFASNINDRTEPCYNDYEMMTGCDLWMAQIVYNVTQGTFEVTNLESVRDASNAGEWHADLLVTDKAEHEYLVYYTHFTSGGTEAANNRISGFTTDADTWVINQLECPDSSYYHEEANFPAIAESGDFLAYTDLSNGNKNIIRYALDTNYEMTGTPFLFSRTDEEGGLCKDHASDPVFVRETDHTLVYHCPADSYSEAMMATKVVRTVYNNVANDVTDGCGHFTSTQDSDWVACSASGSGDVYYYDTYENPTNRELNTLEEETRKLIDQDDEFYADVSGWDDLEDCSSYLTQSFTSFGDTSTWVLFAVNCANAGIAKLFLAKTDPTNPDPDFSEQGSTIIYVSGAIEEYLDENNLTNYTTSQIEALNFCSGDFDMYTLF